MGKRGRPPHPDILTPREWEVLALLRLELSNPEIGERLGISRDGAKYHVSQILAKLGLESREQAARWQSEDAQPWWATAFAPLFPAWRRAAALAGGASGTAAKAALLVVVLAAVGGLGLLALLLFLQDGDGDDAPTLAAGSAQLSYIDEDGALWLVNADGSDRRKLADDAACSEMRWSPTGDTLLCQGGAGVLFDSAGDIVGEAPNFGVGGAHWSPSGEFLLYSRFPDDVPQTIELHLADKGGRQLAQLGSWATGSRPAPPPYLVAVLWSAFEDSIFYTNEENGDILVYSAATGESRVVGRGHRPLAWAMGGRALVVASNDQPPPENEQFGTYEVNLLDIATGELTRLSPLDTYTQFWISPTEPIAAHVTLKEPGSTSPGFAIANLLTGESISIEGSTIGFPSEGIPIHFVQFSPDGELIYWNGGDGAFYKVRTDGSGFEKLFELDVPFPFVFAEWSPDASILAYAGPGSEDEEGRTVLYVRRSDDSAEYEVASVSGSRLQFAWRPVPR